MKGAYNYSKLYGRIRECKISQKLLAQQIGMSETSLNHSLTGKRYFKQEEIAQICRKLDIGYEEIPRYFFTH